MSFGTRTGFGVALGVVLGGAAGAIAGARVESWTGGLVGAYGGIVCGVCVLGGLAGVTTRRAAPADRAEALLGLVFGVFATAGAVAGYWAGTTDFPRLSPLAGFFLGLILPGTVAAMVAVRILGERADPAIGLLLLFGPAGAGAGAWLGTVLGSPVAVAAGLVLGSVLGTSTGHSLNVAAHEAARRAHHSRRRW